MLAPRPTRRADPSDLDGRPATLGGRPADVFKGHREGGYISGPGTGTSDSIFARLSNGEYVIPARIVSALGIGFFDELIGRRSTRKHPGDGSEGLAFARGGPVAWPFPVTAAKTWTPSRDQLAESILGAAIQAGVGGVQTWIRSQTGKPYGWARTGPDAWDCSGLVGGAWGLMQGKSPYQRYFTTATEAPFFPKSGFGLFTAGWAHAGERGGGSVGHTVGNLAGLKFESRGGDGVVVGDRATPVTSLAHVGHYDDGGWLPTGLTIARNETGKPEAILTDGQWRAMQAMVNRPQAGGDRSLVAIEHYHENGADPYAVAADLDWRSRGMGR